MNRNYFFILVGLAAASLLLIFFSMGYEKSEPPAKESLIPHPISPYKSFISGVGVVEASTENINISSLVNRIIEKILVKVGSKVKKGDVLIQLENRDLKANLAIQEAAYKNALARQQKLEAMPRPEDLASAEAVVRIAQAEWDQAKQQQEMVLSLPDPRAISQEEKNKRFSGYQQADARKQQAQAELDKIKAGAWKPDLEIAKLETLQAEANVESIKTEIQRTAILSPIDGRVLQIKVHEGESPDVMRTPLMIIGNTDDMHLRVSINQFDVPFFRSDAPAVAFLQGDARVKFPLEFIQIEPYLINKQNLTNDISERVDTRVLQVIYKIEKEDRNVFVGQQMDVFIETKNSP